MRRSGDNVYRVWARTRARGPWRFVLVHGVLTNGLLMGGIVLLLLWSTGSLARQPWYAWIYGIGYPVFGLLGGWLSWSMNERLYHRWLDRHRFDPPPERIEKAWR